MSEQKNLDAAVDEFAEAMKARLSSKRKQGWGGWDDANIPALFDRMSKNMFSAAKGDKKSLVDVANLAMMIHRQST